MRNDDEDVAKDCVGFLIRAGDAVLAERRSMTKPVMPGALAIPGGHVEADESLDDALRRELQEELNVVPRQYRLVGVFLHRSQELRRLHYFAIDGWDGEIENHEAESLHWVPLDDLDRLDLDVDRLAIARWLTAENERG